MPHERTKVFGHMQWTDWHTVGLSFICDKYIWPVIHAFSKLSLSSIDINKLKWVKCLPLPLFSYHTIFFNEYIHVWNRAVVWLLSMHFMRPGKHMSYKNYLLSWSASIDLAPFVAIIFSSNFLNSKYMFNIKILIYYLIFVFINLIFLGGRGGGRWFERDGNRMHNSLLIQN